MKPLVLLRISAAVASLLGPGCELSTSSGAATGLHAVARARVGETDAPALFDVVRANADGAPEVVAAAVLAAAADGDDLLIVDRENVLFRVSGDRKVRVIDRAIGRPAVLLGGAIVVSRIGDEPGESDLWLIPVTGPIAPLAPAPGPDDMPTALPDGRVAFVSGRTTVASWWVVDPRAGEPVQLTNRGLVAGTLEDAPVPSPAERAEVIEGRLVWEGGDGRSYELDPTTGALKVQRP